MSVGQVTKKCAECGTPFTVKASAAHKRQRCSRACWAKYLSRDMRGPKNHNFSNAGHKTCLQCGAPYYAYAKYRKFCCYRCFLDSGGAFRAGLASRAATMKYGAKKDANHKDLMEALQERCAAYDLSSAGCGIPDGIAWIPPGMWQFFDIKNPKTGYGRRGLNKVQKEWIKQWEGGPVYLLYTVEDAAKFAAGDLDGLKSEPEGRICRKPVISMKECLIIRAESPEDAERQLDLAEKYQYLRMRGSE